jgi:protein ImuB
VPPTAAAAPLSTPPAAAAPLVAAAPPPAVTAVLPSAARHAHTKPLWYAVVFAMPPEAPPVDLHTLSLYAQQFTSLVSIEPPNALLLEVRGSVQLFGSLARLRALLDACWQKLALTATSAVAPSTLAALWCARAGDHEVGESATLLAGRLAKLPIACTGWDGERLQRLRSLGITRLGEVLRLPRAGLARRLGSGAVLDLDIALGKQAGPRRAFVPRERFRQRRDFETEIDNVAYLEKALEPLIEACARFLRRRQAGLQRLELRLRHRQSPPTRVRLGFASVTSEQRRLTDVLTQQLSRLELNAPVLALELVSGTLQPLSGVSRDAFAGSGCSGRDTAAELVERLRARLGECAVYGVSTLAEHRPEAAWRRVHELQLAVLPNGAPNGSASCAADMPRPLWLLAEPQRWPGGDTLSPHEAPERIESGWWDGRGVARDYYRVRAARGIKLWVFQERHTKCWYLHGVFA